MCTHSEVKLMRTLEKEANLGIDKDFFRCLNHTLNASRYPLVHNSLETCKPLSHSDTSKPKHVYYYTRLNALGKELQTVAGFGNKKSIKWLDGKWGKRELTPCQTCNVV